MPEAWQQRIETIASNLLTLEVNTAVKSEGISAQKMPELPLALHSLVQTYGDYLAECGCPVTPCLVALAAQRLISDKNDAVDVRLRLKAWDPRQDKADPAALTNGAESFEALLWAAAACADARRRARPKREPDSWMLARIDANGRQIREAAIVLEQQFSSKTAYEVRLKALVQQANAAAQAPAASNAQANAAAQVPATTAYLFGGTVDQTVEVLFKHPRPMLSIEPDLTVLIRKAWDIGREEVRFQTALQLDGDVLVRVANEADLTQQNYLAELHRQAVQDGIAQWRLMFQVIGELIGGIGRLIFGRGP